MNINALTTLFMTKHNMGKKHHVLPLLTARITMCSVSLWKLSHDEIPVHTLYLRAACSTLIANHGVGWAYDELVRERPLRRSSDQAGALGGIQVVGWLGNLRLIITSHVESRLDSN